MGVQYDQTAAVGRLLLGLCLVLAIVAPEAKFRLCRGRQERIASAYLSAQQACPRRA
jgi:hypothetical protein